MEHMVEQYYSNPISKEITFSYNENTIHLSDNNTKVSENIFSNIGNLETNPVPIF